MKALKKIPLQGFDTTQALQDPEIRKPLVEYVQGRQRKIETFFLDQEDSRSLETGRLRLETGESE